MIFPELDIVSEVIPQVLVRLRDTYVVVDNDYDRVVIGGGLFGVFAALTLAQRGYRVCLVEQTKDLLTRASHINQARLHTGLHYPRSLETALESLVYYEKFRNSYPSAVRDFDQIYAISRFGSKTSGQDFLNFIQRLGTKVKEISPDRYFNQSSVSNAFQVEEPTFDASELRRIFREKIDASPNVTLILGAQVIGGEVESTRSSVRLNDGRILNTDGIVIATYANLNGVRQVLGLEPMPLAFELVDVYLGEVPMSMKNVGFTVMDGPFWSMMPFGHSGFSSLTSVGLTPLAKSRGFPIFQCQSERSGCLPTGIAVCNECSVRPVSNYEHVIQQVSLHLKNAHQFRVADRLTTVKAILTTSEVDDSRPTVIQKEKHLNVWTIFSGKVTTFFDIEEGLF